MSDRIPTDDGWSDAVPEPPRAARGTATASAPSAQQKLEPESVSSVLGAWAREGALIHEPTGIPRLDELTGGGPVYGSRWYLLGAPDAGKTALLVQLAHTWAERGIMVGLLAVDEEPSDIVTRLAQRKGYARRDTEIRDAVMLGAMADALAHLPIRIYDASWTIEAAADDLREAAREGRAALLIDSLQTVHCQLERFAEREMGDVQAVTLRTRAIRAVASRHHLVTLATSEMGRSSYATDEARRTTSTLASAKWSGAVEYSGRVVLGLRSVTDQPDLIEVEIAKNKHGPRDERFRLRIDRLSQSLWEVAHTEPPPSDERAARAQRAQARSVEDAAIVATILLETPSLGLRELRGAARAKTGMGHDRVDAALATLGPALERRTGARGARPMSVSRDRLPSDVAAKLEASP